MDVMYAVPAAAPPSAPVHRRNGRVCVNFRAALRRQGAQRFPVQLVDLSAHGFCSEVDDPLPVGATLWLTLPGLTPLIARVAWVRDFRIGAEFEVPLHPSVLQTVVARAG